MEAFKRFELDPNSPEYREMKMAAIRKYRTRSVASGDRCCEIAADTVEK